MNHKRHKSLLTKKKKTVRLLSCLLWFYLPLGIYNCQKTLPSPTPIIKAKQIKHRSNAYDVVSIDQPQHIQFFWKDKTNNRYASLERLQLSLKAKNKNLVFAMNGGMYLKDGSPQGLYVENKKWLTKTDTTPSAYGNFYLQPNGIFYLTDSSAVVSTTIDFMLQQPSPTFATQSGPMLVIDNQLHAAFKEGSSHLHIRNGVGIRADGTVVFAISNNKVNLYDFARLFKDELNCPNALYLDGFVSKAFIEPLKRKDKGGNFGVIIGVVD